MRNLGPLVMQLSIEERKSLLYHAKRVAGRDYDMAMLPFIDLCNFKLRISHKNCACHWCSLSRKVLKLIQQAGGDLENESL